MICPAPDYCLELGFLVAHGFVVKDGLLCYKDAISLLDEWDFQKDC